MAGAQQRRIRAARGVEAADLVLAGGTVVDVLSGTLRRADVAIADGCIVGASAQGYEAARTIDCSGAFLAPGLIDGHLHLESSLLAPWVFAAAAAAHGTTTVVADPHEIANVTGLAGVRFVADSARGSGCEILLTAPSCVPATPLDTAGAELSPEDIAALLAWPTVVGLGDDELPRRPGGGRDRPRDAGGGGRPTHGRSRARPGGEGP